MSQEPSDQTLMIEIANGHSAAFHLLCARHSATVLALAKQILANESDAEDITQDVFIALWQQAPEWEDRGYKISTWLYRVTMNRCFNHINRVKKRMIPTDSNVLNDNESTEHTPEQHLLTTEKDTALNQAMKQLPDSHRAAISLFYTAGASTADTAIALGLTTKAAESLLVRARKGLKQALKSFTEASK